jgi:HK97 gp10 family phage protein
MADRITFSINGIDKLKERLKAMDQKVKDALAMELRESAMKIQKEAKRNAPVDMGTLRNSIYMDYDYQKNKLTYSIGASASYAPYIEFGTGGSVKVPAKYSSYALTFKGKSANGGSLDEFMLAIMDWVKRKGITGTYSVKTQRRTGSRGSRMSEDFDVAFAIMLKILKKGINPQPFLLPAYEAEKVNLVKKIKQAIKDAKP